VQDGSPRLAESDCGVAAGHAARYEEHRMEPVVIAGFG